MRANLLYDPGFESYVLTNQVESSTGDPILNEYFNNDLDKVFNSYGADFELKQYHLSSALISKTFDFRQSGVYGSYCQRILPIVGEEYLLAFNIYLDPVIEHGTL